MSSENSLQLKISGMTCNGCVRNVRSAIERVSGVASADVELESGRARVNLESSDAQISSRVLDAVRESGFQGKILQDGGAPDEESWRTKILSGWTLNVALGGASFLILAVSEWVFGLHGAPWFRSFAFALATVVQVLCGRRFYVGAWNQLKSGNTNMDTLVSLGSTTAYAFSVLVYFGVLEGHLYFMESVGIITFISVGHWLESRMSRRASDSLKSLLNLSPKKALLLTDEGESVEKPVDALKVGDRVVVLAGDQVPIDCEVLEGESSVDESMLTGESRPVSKSRGDQIYGGTLNHDGKLIARVKGTGKDTALARIIQVVQKAQNSRANIQRLGDQVSSVFVPIVVVFALSVGIFWLLAPEKMLQCQALLANFLWAPYSPGDALARAVIYTAAVFIIACPCAMGLATPVAIMVGANAASRKGILIRDGQALEKSGVVDTVVFDKTGTLTQNRTEIVDKKTAAASRLDRALPDRIAASLAAQSKHPLSRALAGVSDSKLDLISIKEHHGKGLEAALADSNRTVRLGSAAWLSEYCAVPEDIRSFVESGEDDSTSTVLLAVEDQVEAAYLLRDPLKSGAADIVRELSRSIDAIYIITGDRRSAADRIAKELSLPSNRVFAEVRPEQKAEKIRELQEQGRKVAFVGDGVNDAPALKQADLGIAVSNASDIAMESADIVLLNSEIEAIPQAIRLARRTLRVIKQNLFWAFFYNAAAVPLAAFGFLNPILCALAMGLSDVVVIGNALRLKRFR